MRIDNWIRKCVTFLYIESTDTETGIPTKVPVATTFFVAIPSNHDSRVVYAVTARHVIDESRPNGALFLRMNVDGGGDKYLRIGHDEERWKQHDTADVAVTRVTTWGEWDT